MTSDRSRGVKQALAWLLLFLLIAWFALTLDVSRLRWDGILYFAPLRSLYFDGDIQLQNEAEHFDWLAEYFGAIAPDEPVPNPFAVGSALLWSPFYLLADLVCRLQISCQRDGYSQLYVRAVFAATAFWASLGLVLNVVALRKLLKTDRWRVAALSVATLALASPLVFYLLLRPDYAHGNAYFAVALVLFLTVDGMAHRPISLQRALLCGLAIGLVFVIRWSDVLVGLMPIALLFWPDRALRGRREWSGLAQRLLALCAGILVPASLQLLAWQATFGLFVTVPQGSGFLSLAHVEAVKFFFSTWNGLFLWHPILLLALCGFFIAPSRFFPAWGVQAQRLRYAIVVVVVLELVVNMAVADWWAGGAFGQRRLVSLLPLLSVGLCHLFVLAAPAPKIYRALLAGLLCILIGWNLLSMVRFRQGRLPFNPADVAWYDTGRPYEHFDYSRRFQDILLGRKP